MQPDAETLRELNDYAAALPDLAEREKAEGIARCYQAWFDASERLAALDHQGASPAERERAQQDVARCQRAFEEWSA